MGWTSSPEWTTTAAVKAAILAECFGTTSTVVQTAATCAGKHLWILADDRQGTRRIFLFLIEGGSTAGYAWKSMDESMHPYTYDCPLAFLDMAPETSAKWRDGVRKFHARKGAKFVPGDKVMSYGKPYTVVGPCKRSWLVQDAEGNRYKASPAHMRLAAEVEAEARAEREAALASPYIVVSASGDWCPTVPEGMVGVIATPGGNRKGIGEERRALVPADRYRGGYVLDGSEPAWIGR